MDIYMEHVDMYIHMDADAICSICVYRKHLYEYRSVHMNIYANVHMNICGEYGMLSCIFEQGAYGMLLIYL